MPPSGDDKRRKPSTGTQTAGRSSTKIHCIAHRLASSPPQGEETGQLQGGKQHVTIQYSASSSARPCSCCSATALSPMSVSAKAKVIGRAELSSRPAGRSPCSPASSRRSCSAAPTPTSIRSHARICGLQGRLLEARNLHSGAGRRGLIRRDPGVAYLLCARGKTENPAPSLLLDRAGRPAAGGQRDDGGDRDRDAGA